MSSTVLEHHLYMFLQTKILLECKNQYHCLNSLDGFVNINPICQHNHHSVHFLHNPVIFRHWKNIFCFTYIFCTHCLIKYNHYTLQTKHSFTYTLTVVPFPLSCTNHEYNASLQSACTFKFHNLLTLSAHILHKTVKFKPQFFPISDN